MTQDVLSLQAWRGLTKARIGLQRSGASLSTNEVLTFALDHARARDAVHEALDVAALCSDLQALGFETLPAASAAPDRQTYLARPDLGAVLSPASAEVLTLAANDGFDLAIVLADGLSSRALRHATAVLGPLTTVLKDQDWKLGPIVVATQGRVALGDQIGACLGASMVLVLIGERPGLSSPDSLGAYLTWSPVVGRTNAERNCVSNIRPEGLPPDAAAETLAWLLTEARRRRLTGIELKDLSGLTSISSP